MPTTSRFAIPYPSPDDNPDGPAQMQALAEKVDAAMFAAFPGDLKFSARTGEHGNWIKADGRALTAGQYDALRNALIADGSPYGNTGGNPRVPDLRGRTAVGAGAGAGLTSRTNGQAGGTETVALTIAQMPNHAHEMSTAAAAGGVAGRMAPGSGFGPDELTQPNGSSAAHPNMQPYAVGTWFIYAA